MTRINGGPCHTIRGYGDDIRVVHTTPCSCGPNGEFADAVLEADRLQFNMVQLVVTEADVVLCTRCLVERQQGAPADFDIRNWKHSYVAWHPDLPCSQCGRTSPYDEGLTPEERLQVQRVRQQRRQPSPYFPSLDPTSPEQIRANLDDPVDMYGAGL